ncbi:MAG: pseudouridine synthase [Brumimicrobium sp.]
METYKPLEILYKDDWIVAINKPAGLLVHRSSIANNTSVFAVQLLRDQLGYYVYPIHRLDRKTSGILLFAKNSCYVSAFQQELANEKTQKKYIAIVRGYFPSEIIVNHALRKENGQFQEAETHFKCLATTEIDLAFGKFDTSRYSIIEAFPKTGRMHQIRKHLNHLRHPIIGDRPHGCNKQNKLFLKKWGLTKMLLHAEELNINHPYLDKKLSILAERPSHFKEMIISLNV